VAYIATFGVVGREIFILSRTGKFESILNRHFERAWFETWKAHFSCGHNCPDGPAISLDICHSQSATSFASQWPALHPTSEAHLEGPLY
jgi:hypothetical protein